MYYKYENSLPEMVEIQKQNMFKVLWWFSQTSWWKSGGKSVGMFRNL